MQQEALQGLGYGAQERSEDEAIRFDPLLLFLEVTGRPSYHSLRAPIP